MVNWQDISSEFTEELQQEWIDKGFSYETCKEWIDIGLKLEDYGYASWLKNQSHVPEKVLNEGNAEELRQEYQRERERDWADIHELFSDDRWQGKEYQSFWKNHGFDYQATKEWKEVLGKDFDPKVDWAFCVWLRDEKNLNTQKFKQQGNVKDLKTNYNKKWTDAYKDFSEESNVSYQEGDGPDYHKTYQQEWEEKGLTYQDAQEWTPLGFKLKDYEKIKKWKEKFAPHEARQLIELVFLPTDSKFAKQWKDLGFSLEEIKEWIKASLNPTEARFANYLKQKNIQPSELTTDKLFQLRKEFYCSSAQAHLEKHYPWKERKDLRELNLRNFNLEGDLDLEGFSDWLKIYLAGNPNLGEIKNIPSWGEITYQNFQEYLKEKYSDKDQVKEIKFSDLVFEEPSELIIDDYPNLKEINGNGSLVSEVTKIVISNCPKLEKASIHTFDGENDQKPTLTLDNLPNLKELDCSQDNLTTLDLSKCSSLQKVNCWNNHDLAEIKFSPNAGEKLEELYLSSNDFNQDLSFLSGLVNLRELYLSGNKFTGSLEFLKDMNKLEELDINDTDIDSGLEYLPDSLERGFNCSARWRKDAKVKVLEGIYQHFNQDLKKIRENNSAQLWLNENYPENRECQKKTKNEGWDDSKGWNNKGKKREQITNLDISYESFEKTKLKGWLSFKGFTRLEKLNCSGHQLTYLFLSDCPNLIEIKCDNNELRDLDFLKDVNKLEKLWVRNNKNLAEKDLEAFSSLKNLEHLDISNCPFGGSLKPLKDLNDLTILVISNTDISEGLEYLPESCNRLFCNSVYPHQSTKLMEDLEKSKSFKEISEEKYEKEENQAFKQILSNHYKKYYIPEKWRTDQANSKIALAIPLEKLFVIRGNLKQFINKWGKNDKIQKLEIELKKLLDKEVIQKKTKDLTKEIKEIEDIRTKIKQEKRNLSTDENNWKTTELGKLQIPEQYGKYRYFGGVKWIARATAVTGGVLALTDQPIIGGSLAAASPFVDAISSYFEENYYKKGEEKWNEFLKDADMFLDNYHELLAITKSIKTSKRGKINKMFGDLKGKLSNFLEDYDQEDENEETNEEIDLGELIAKQKSLAQELTKKKDESKLWKIMDVTKKLEDQVTAYRQGEDIEKEVIEKATIQTESTEPENQEVQLYQQIKEEVEKEEYEKEAKLEKQRTELEKEKNKYRQIRDQQNETQKVLSFLEEKAELTNEESNLLKSLKEKVGKLKKNNRKHCQ